MADIYPIIIVTVYNRKRETEATLKALAETTDLTRVEVAIIDNGSTDGAGEFARAWGIKQVESGAKVIVHAFAENLGIPRALNFALLQYRKPGQPVVKLDNDVRLLTPEWVQEVQNLAEALQTRDKQMATIRAYREGMPNENLLKIGIWKGQPVYYARRALGYAVWYTATFMDRVGYFDVLSSEHLYGFEDVIMSHKAALLGWDEWVWAGWQIEDIQKSSAIRGKGEHVERMRPFYQQRAMALTSGGPIWTGPSGRPGENR